MNDYSEIKDFIEQPLQLIHSKALVKNPQLSEKVRQIFERINETLENNLFNYHRSCIGGSCGKETALSDTFDLDIIVFVDIEDDITVENYIRQRESTLKQLEKIILQNLDVRKRDKPTSKYSFSFTCKDTDIDVDLVVAVNRLGHDEEGATDAVDRQRNKIFDLIHKDRINEPYFNANELNSSITETIVKFYIDQSEFVKNFIILCKYWLHLYCTDVHFSGKSSTIELIAIDVGNRMEKQGDLAAAFKLFIHELMSINKIQICFCSRLNDDRLEQRFVDHKPPFLNDPQNPYNNRLKRLKYKEKRDIQLIAKETMKNIELHEIPTNYPYNFILILLLYISFIVFGMFNTDGGVSSESLPVPRSSLINDTIAQIQNEVRYQAEDSQNYLSTAYRLASIIEKLNHTYSIKNRASDCTVFENFFLACQFHETYYFMKLKSMYLIDAMIAVDNLDCSFMGPEFQASLAPRLSHVSEFLFLWKEYLSLEFYKEFHLSNQIEIKDKERVIYENTVNKIDDIAQYILNILNMKNNELKESYSQKVFRYLRIGWEKGKKLFYKIKSALF